MIKADRYYWPGSKWLDFIRIIVFKAQTNEKIHYQFDVPSIADFKNIKLTKEFQFNN